MNFKLLPALAAVGLLSAAPAFSATLDFEGVNSAGSINNFYNGGFDIPADSATTPASGVNYGVSFGGDLLAFTSDSGAFSNAPTPGTIMAVQGLGTDAAMNVAVGFAGQVSFYYSSTVAADITVYDGLNGTGNVLATYSLVNNAQSNCNDTAFCNWSLAQFNFNGIAKSIQFANAVGGVAGFDNVTVSAVPLPAAAWLLLSGLGGLGSLVRRKRNV